jgi:hypothetical protein
MAISVGYGWTATTAPDFLNNLVQSFNQAQPAIAGSPDGARYFATWTDTSGVPDVNLRGRPVASTGTPVADEFLVTSTVAGVQSQSSIAALNNSTWVVAFTDISTPRTAISVSAGSIATATRSAMTSRSSLSTAVSTTPIRT